MQDRHRHQIQGGRIHPEDMKLHDATLLHTWTRRSGRRLQIGEECRCDGGTLCSSTREAGVEMRRELEKEEAQRRAEEEAARLEEEHAKAENKAWKRKQKKRVEEEKRVEMQNDMKVQLAIHVGELEHRLVQQLNQVVSSIPPTQQNRGKKNVTCMSEDDGYSSNIGEGSDTSVTQELTARMVISEKWKRGPEPVFDDPSPPMEMPAKRTPKGEILKPVKLTGRLTRSKSKKVGGCLMPASNKNKISMPLSKRRTPTRKRVLVPRSQPDVSLERLRYHDNVLRKGL
ncbi:hypothetical protein CBR_g34567 [Chara braunii]|uniref:Uncharacterized protein n=1 Tax=Chara braunii TaxID=69332 RepID=A0A388LJ64_CHABU|nr:hypothetical protein CBR_g34567 [Chara braunii]|eukprot:GBG82283.1 hypothetical protein CBR_g34567 [Chara braunii]